MERSLTLIARALAVFILIGSLVAFCNTAPEFELRNLTLFSSWFLVIFVGLAISLAQPLLAQTAVIAWFTYYLFLYHLPVHLFPTLVYIVLVFWGSMLCVRKLSRGPYSKLLGDTQELQLMAAGALFTATVFLSNFIFLTFHIYTATTLLCFAFLWSSACSYRERHAIFETQDTGTFKFSKVESSASQHNLLNVCLLLTLVVYAVLYLYPGDIVGDAEKSYLAYARFYALSNSIIIREPIWRDLGDTRMFGHVEEIFLSAGYLLGQNLGAKMLAIIIVLLKLQAFYSIARYLFNFSALRARYLLTCFCLMPIVIELQSGVRPENLLALFVLYTIYLLEVSSSPDIARNPRVKQMGLALTCWFLALGVGVKYTAFFFGIGIALVYWRQWAWLLKNFASISRTTQTVLVASVLIGSFWYIRNIVMFHTLVSMTPYGKYHLTYYFPPIRSFSQAWEFVTQAYVFSQKYTEFPNYAYFFWGALFFPALFWGATLSGATRRISLLCLIFLTGLLSATVQIRYTAIILPFLLALVFALHKEFSASRIGQSFSTWAPINWLKTSCALILVFLTLFFAYWRIQASVVGAALAKRLTLEDVDLSQALEPYRSINTIAPFPNKIFAPYLDHNYSLEAKMLRADPIRDLTTLLKYHQEYSVDYWMMHSYFFYDNADGHNFFFSDPHFIESIADFVADPAIAFDPNWKFVLYKPNQKLLNRLLETVKKNQWSFDGLSIVSQTYKEKDPFHVTLGERIDLPGSKHQLYRLKGYWRADDRTYQDLGGLPTFKDGLPLAYYFDQGLNQPPIAKALDVKKEVHNISEVEGSATQRFFSLKERYQRGSVHYSFIAPEAAPQDQILLNVYIRGQLASNSQGISVKIKSAGHTHYGGVAEFPHPDQFVLAGSAVVPSHKKVNVAITLPCCTTERIAIRDVRLVMEAQRRLPQQEPKPPLRLPIHSMHAPPLTVGQAIDPGLPVMWAYENFNHSKKASSPGTESESFNLKHVERGLAGGAVAPMSINTQGRIVYTFDLPIELYSDLTAKVFLRGEARKMSDALRVTIRDPNANPKTIIHADNEGVIEKQERRAWKHQDSWDLVSDVFIPYIATATDGSKSKKLEVTLTLESSINETDIFLQDIAIVIGKHKNTERPLELLGFPADITLSHRFDFEQNLAWFVDSFDSAITKTSSELSLARKLKECHVNMIESKEIVLKPESTSKPGQIFYTLKLPERLATTPLYVQLFLAGRAYSADDRIEVSLPGEGQRCTTTLMAFTYPRNKPMLAAECLLPVHSAKRDTLDLTLRLKSDTFADRAFLTKLVAAVGIPSLE